MQKMNRVIIEPESVLALAFTAERYTSKDSITAQSILVAQQKYLEPVIGEAMIEAIGEGRYITLFDDYVAPALAEYVRIVADLPSAPADKKARVKARAMMARLSQFLEDNLGDYPEYEPTKNVLRRCAIRGGFVQVR